MLVTNGRTWFPSRDSRPDIQGRGRNTVEKQVLLKDELSWNEAKKIGNVNVLFSMNTSKIFVIFIRRHLSEITLYDIMVFASDLLRKCMPSRCAISVFDPMHD